MAPQAGHDLRRICCKRCPDSLYHEETCAACPVFLKGEIYRRIGGEASLSQCEIWHPKVHAAMTGAIW